MCVKVEEEEGRRRKCRPIILLNCFSAEKAKTETSPTKHKQSPSHSLPPAFIFTLILRPLTVLAISLSLLSIYPKLSHCPDKAMVRCCTHSPALATVAWIQHVKNHINTSPEEGVSASNGTGLQEKEDTVCRGARGWSGTEVLHNWGGVFGNIQQKRRAVQVAKLPKTVEMTYCFTVYWFMSKCHVASKASWTVPWRCFITRP